MTLEKRINAFSILGLFLKQFKYGKINESLANINKRFYNDFDELMTRQKALNGWFDRKNVENAVEAIANSLAKDEIEQWMNKYPLKDKDIGKTIGVIMAGNIPLVGFHDFLSVLLSGNQIIIKLSSEDNTLLKKVAEILIEIEPGFADKIRFVEKLENFEAVIATGSNNTARYFKQYFGNYPHIIRKNRNSVAIISINDTIEELKELGKDVFKYYGLGCRSVSKLYIPKGFAIDKIFEAFYLYQEVIDNNKYANNYDYNKAVYLLGNHKLLDNNFLLLKEDVSLTSPVGVLHYEYYDDIIQLEQHLENIEDELQCIVSSKNTPLNTLRFGESQNPQLSDYADGVDTVEFLLNLT